MFKTWLWVLALCTLLMPVNVVVYVCGWISQAALILVTLVLSYVALQLTAAAGIVAALAAKRVKELAES